MLLFLFENMYIINKFKQLYKALAKIHIGACTQFVCNTRQHNKFRNIFCLVNSRFRLCSEHFILEDQAVILPFDMNPF